MMRSLSVPLLVLSLVWAFVVGPARAAPAKAQVIVLSNSSPHVSVIDAQSSQVIKTADIPQMTSWAWNDDNNYYDGKHLWLGMRNPDTNEVEVILLDLDSLQVARRIPLGQDRVTVYIGKPSRQGKVLVSKHASGEIVAIDARSFAVVSTATLPVEGGFACDIDIAPGPGNIDRAFVPTNPSDLIIAVDAATLRVLQTVRFPGNNPFMLTASPDGSQVWVQERAGNSLAVLNARTLQLVKRLPTGKTPIIGTFSPDGARHFTGHSADTQVIAHDTRTFKEVWRAHAGTNPDKLGVHPAGTFVFAALSREGAVAVLDARTGKVAARIALGTNPVGIFVRRLR